MMMNQWWRWEGGVCFSAQGCFTDKNVQDDELESATIYLLSPQGLTSRYAHEPVVRCVDTGHRTIWHPVRRLASVSAVVGRAVGYQRCRSDALVRRTPVRFQNGYFHQTLVRRWPSDDRHHPKLPCVTASLCLANAWVNNKCVLFDASTSRSLTLLRVLC
jgi:hypothetical protein